MLSATSLPMLGVDAADKTLQRGYAPLSGSRSHGPARLRPGLASGALLAAASPCTHHGVGKELCKIPGNRSLTDSESRGEPELFGDRWRYLIKR
jgi:hypothetical protein